MVDIHLLLSVRSSQQLEEVLDELITELIDILLGVFADQQHFPRMGFALGMHLERIRVPTLLLAYLAVPSKPLQPLRLELVAQVLRRPNFCLRHLDVVGAVSTSRSLSFRGWR